VQGTKASAPSRASNTSRRVISVVGLARTWPPPAPRTLRASPALRKAASTASRYLRDVLRVGDLEGAHGGGALSDGQLEHGADAVAGPRAQPHGTAFIL